MKGKLMSKSMLKCLPVLVAFFFLFSVPAIAVALDENPSVPTIIKASFETDQTQVPLRTAPSWELRADSKCIGKCVQDLMKCKLENTAPDAQEECEKSFDKCMENCDSNMMSVSQLMRRR